MSQLDRDAAEAGLNSEGLSDSKKRDWENRRQERTQQMEQYRLERARLMEELDHRTQAVAEKGEKERGLLRMRLQKAQTSCGLASVILVLLGIHGLVAGFVGSGGGSTGGFPVVPTSGGKVENSIPGALRPKRPAN